MADIQIVRAIRTDCRVQGHVSAVLIGSTEYTVQQVYHLMDGGNVLYTESPSTGERAKVEEWSCSCGQPTLRSTGAIHDNDLTELSKDPRVRPLQSRMPPPLPPRRPWE